MRNVILSILLSLCVSCGSLRRSVVKEEINVDSTSVVSTLEITTERNVDTTSITTTTVTITEFEFFQPAQGEVDSAGCRNPQSQGAVKTIRTTVIEKDVEKRGERNESNTRQEMGNVATITRNKGDVHIQQNNTAFRWRCFFFLALVVTILIAIYRAPIIERGRILFRRGMDKDER